MIQWAVEVNSAAHFCESVSSTDEFRRAASPRRAAGLSVGFLKVTMATGPRVAMTWIGKTSNEEIEFLSDPTAGEVRIAIVPAGSRSFHRLAVPTGILLPALREVPMATNMRLLTG
jgi:hypothetical protein